jgi:ArsR family transcriptional regulator
MSNIEPLSEDLDRIKRYARMFSALSNPHRLRLFMRVFENMPPGTKRETDDSGVRDCQRDTARHFGLAPSTISHHVKELNDAGLIEMRRDGQRVTMWVDEDSVHFLAEFLKL